MFHVQICFKNLFNKIKQLFATRLLVTLNMLLCAINPLGKHLPTTLTEGLIFSQNNVEKAPMYSKKKLMFLSADSITQ